MARERDDEDRRSAGLPTSSIERLLRLTGLVGRVGASLASTRLLALVQAEATRQARRSDALVRNATRIVETLGRMKGGAMKAGQMLSLHADLLPPEVSEVLCALQKEAPRVPAEVMEYEVQGALGPRYERLFRSFDREAFAAASIGQVHRAVLRDGRTVAVKVQYPMIREIIEADLRNLRTLFGAMVGLVSDIDFAPIWREVRDRLREELDYTQEAAHMRRLTALYADMPEIVIPGIVDEASTDRVLTMEMVEGLSPDWACSSDVAQALRDEWGRALFEFTLRGLLVTGWLHADPNLANFGFLPDGRVIVYDFGCVKHLPGRLMTEYATLTRAALDDRRERVPAILKRMGLRKQDGAAIARQVTDPYFELLAQIYRRDPRYTFGGDPGVYRTLFELGMANLSEASDLVVPHDLVFVNRTLAGTFGNLTRLRATADWRAVAERCLRTSERS
jgi:predicted unusual protein kinase regulating ubiquinone biosynthesis (AarF/ABC1/UbiB family)